MRTTELSYASLEVNKLEAFLELMFLAAHADGEIAEAERAAFRQQVSAETPRPARARAHRHDARPRSRSTSRSTRGKSAWPASASG
jgi:hypothetical protein